MGRLVYIGIDPGQKGAIAFIDVCDDVSVINIKDMPLQPNGEINAVEFRHILVEHKSGCDSVVCALEKAQPMPSQSAQSGFNYGVGYGAIKSMLSILRIPFQEIPPVKWKKSFSLPKIGKGKGGKKKGKQESITKCIELFPDTPTSVYYGPKGGMKDGIAEALLLAEYARRSL